MALKRMRGIKYPGFIPEYHKAEAASQTFEDGAPVIEDANGRLTEAGTNEPLADIIGIATEDAHNDTTAATHVIGYHSSRLPDFWIRGTVDDGTQILPLAQTHIGREFGITRHAGTRFWYIDTNKVGDLARVKIERELDAIGSLAGNVYFSWIQP